MGNRAVISKEEVLDAAYGIAVKDGLGALSIRAVAQACGVAVGTVYNSYPTKSDLVNDVVALFWREAFANTMRPEDSEDADFIAFCRRLAKEMTQALEKFRSDFLHDLSVLGVFDLAAARRREAASFDHVRKGLQHALASDPAIDRSKLVGALAPEPLCDLVWQVMLDAARYRKPFDETLLALIEGAVYPNESARQD